MPLHQPSCSPCSWSHFQYPKVICDIPVSHPTCLLISLIKAFCQDPFWHPATVSGLPHRPLGQGDRRPLTAGIRLVPIVLVDTESQVPVALNHVPQLQGYALTLPRTQGPTLDEYVGPHRHGTFKSRRLSACHSRPMAIWSCIRQHRLRHATIIQKPPISVAYYYAKRIYLLPTESLVLIRWPFSMQWLSDEGCYKFSGSAILTCGLQCHCYRRWENWGRHACSSLPQPRSHSD